MSAKRIKNTAKLLLLLYVGYFSCVSLFTHTHIYNGTVYIHSHPYKDWTKGKEESKRSPFETHEHTTSAFFTLNQLSSIASLEAFKTNLTRTVLPILRVFTILPQSENIIKPIVCLPNHRAPPFSLI